MNNIKKFFQHKVPNVQELFKFLGPGFIVTVGFIDPGNWATNMEGGATFGYKLLWVVTISTILLIILQYNASKLGIISGKCIAEASNSYFRKGTSRVILYSGMLAVVATIFAELLGGAIALNIIFGLPINIGAIIIALVSLFLIFSNTYNKIEGIIVGFVSIIALSFLVELLIANVDWHSALRGSITPSISHSSIYVIMGIVGAVVMPHNLFLHSEFIQSRTNNTNVSRERYLKLAKYDTTVSMIVGWAINSAMIILAASTFFVNKIEFSQLSQASELLKPLLGSTAAGVFALALLFSGLASSITAGMSGGVIYAGIHDEEYNNHDRHTSLGIIIPIIVSVFIIFFNRNPVDGLILSQVLLSIQLPITIIALILLTSSKKVMGSFKNSTKEKILLWFCALIIIALNIVLLSSFLVNKLT